MLLRLECVCFKSLNKGIFFKWFINKENIEEVDHFTYLVKLVKTGTLRSAVKALHEQALMACNTLLFVCKNVSLDIQNETIPF